MDYDFRKISLLVLMIYALSGCAGMQSRAYSSSYTFLYPDEEARIEEPGVAQLRLPVRVGIAFVPEVQSRQGFNFWTGRTVDSAMPEAEKHALMKRIASAFEGKQFIDSIEVIPSAYVRPRGGFQNLDQLATMYNIDVMALVSYDQIQNTDEDLASLSYWTLVGAYLVKGEKNTTTTLLDTVVYDIKSRRMLFRAPGVSEIQAASTLVNQSQALREDSERGMSLAADDMIKNLDVELDRFRERIKERPQDIQVIQRSGGGGGGVAGGALFAILASCTGFCRRSRR